MISTNQSLIASVNNQKAILMYAVAKIVAGLQRLYLQNYVMLHNLHLAALHLAALRQQLLYKLLDLLHCACRYSDAGVLINVNRCRSKSVS